MARLRVLQDRVWQHKLRIPGDELVVNEDEARRLADEDPEGFVWVDRPVQAFVDIVPQPRKARKRKVDAMGILEVDDGDESTG